jgi:hypothetical protein
MDLFEHLGNTPSFCEAVQQHARPEVLDVVVQTAAGTVGYDFVSMGSCVNAFQYFASLLARIEVSDIPASRPVILCVKKLLQQYSARSRRSYKRKKNTTRRCA